MVLYYLVCIHPLWHEGLLLFLHHAVIYCIQFTFKSASSSDSLHQNPNLLFRLLSNLQRQTDSKWKWRFHNYCEMEFLLTFFYRDNRMSAESEVRPGEVEMRGFFFFFDIKGPAFPQYDKNVTEQLALLQWKDTKCILPFIFPFSTFLLSFLLVFKSLGGDFLNFCSSSITFFSSNQSPCARVHVERVSSMYSWQTWHQILTL